MTRYAIHRNLRHPNRRSAGCLLAVGFLVAGVVGSTGRSQAAAASRSAPADTAVRAAQIPSSGIPAPANDGLAGARVLSGAGGSVTQSIGGSSYEKNEPKLGLGGSYYLFPYVGYRYSVGGSVWFSWTAPTTGTVTFTTAGSDTLTSISVFQGSTFPALKELAAGDSEFDYGQTVIPVVTPVTYPAGVTTVAPPSPPTTAVRSTGGAGVAAIGPGFVQPAVGPIEVVAGTTYTVGVAGTDGGIRLAWNSGPVAVVPANDVTPSDLPAGTVPAGAPAGYSVGRITGSTTGATRSPGEADHGVVGGNHSVWYRYTATAEQVVQFNTAGSSFDTALAVYTPGLVRLAANDDAYSIRTSVTALIRLHAGEVVLVAVDGWDGEHGSFKLGWETLANGPLNDFFRDATAITGSGTADIDLVGASLEDAELPVVGPSVWFRYQSTVPGTVRFSLDVGDTGSLQGDVSVGASIAGLRLLDTMRRDAYPGAPNGYNTDRPTGAITVRPGEPLQVSVSGYPFCCYPGAPLVVPPKLRWTFTPSANAAGRTTALTPQRVLDTRLVGGPLAANTSRTIVLAAQAGIPATGATAAIVNLTATNAATRGYLTATAAGTTADTSNVNVNAGGTAANLAIVPLGSGGAITVFSSTRTDLIVDVLGWVGPAGDDGFAPITPQRVLDTRVRPSGRLGAGEVIEIVAPTLPGGGPADAVAVNLTATDAPSGAFVSAYPSGSPPNTSNLNVATDQTIANLTLVKVGADGKFRLRASAATHLVADVFGVYSPAASMVFEQSTPARIRDDRASNSAQYGFTLFSEQVIRGLGGVPADAKAVVVNLTSSEYQFPSGGSSFPYEVGYVQLYPNDVGSVDTSNLNFRPGADTANLAIVPIGADGRISIRTSSFSTLILDVIGWYR